jgi:hypothetical protein
MVNLSDIEKKIIGDIRSSSEALDNLIVLCDEFGGRLAGSEENRKAAKFILGKFKEYGFENPHLESFKFPGSEVISGKLEMLSPVKKEIPCICLPMTVTGDVEADVVYLGHGENLESQLSELEGKIILTSDRAPIPKSVMAGAIGVIWMRPFPYLGQTTGVTPSILPSVGIKYEDGMMLKRFIERRGGVKAHIKTECRHLIRESWNVCGEIPGNGKSDEFIMFGGHYDGHEIAQAAFDCGAACMASLEIGRILNNYREYLDRNVRVVLFSSEEFGCWGSKDYAKRHAEDMEKMRFTYQFDSCAGGSTQVLTLDHWPELEPFYDNLRTDLNMELPLRQQKGPGDTEAFFKLGIPTGCIREGKRFDYPGSLGGLSTVWHTYNDTVDKIDLRALREVITIGAISGYRMANAEDWPKHRSAEKIEETPIMKNMRRAQEQNKKLKAYLESNVDKLWPEAREYMKRL